MTTQEPRERPSVRARVREWSKRLATWLSLPALVMASAFVLLHNLDQPWVKRRIQAVVAKETGLAIDYGAVRFALSSGIDVDDLVVSSPLEARGAAPELARIGHVVARWSLGSSTRITRLTLTDVTVTIAIDENGRTSVAKLLPPSVPHSRLGAALLGSRLPDAVEVQRLAIVLVSTDHGAVVERTSLRGVALELHRERERGGAARLRLGSEAAPLELDLERHGTRGAEGTAHARAFALAIATSSDLVLSIDLHVGDQSLAPAAVDVGRALHVAGRARFDVPAARTDVTLHAEVTEGAGEAFATIPDNGPPVLHHAVGDVDAGGWLARLPAGLVPIHAERAHVRYRIIEATLAMPPRLDAGGAIEIEGDLAKVRLDAGGASWRVDTGSLSVHMLPGAASGAAVHGSADFRFAHGTVQTSGPIAVDAHDGHFALRLGDVNLANPGAIRGDLALTGEVASVSARSASSSGAASTLAIDAHLELLGHAPYAANAEVTAARLRLFGRAEETLADAPARIAIDVTNATPDLARPIVSTGTAYVEVTLGGATATLRAGKEVDAVDYELHAHAPTLEPARPLLGTLLPLQRMALELESTGRVERISSAHPEMRRHTKLELAVDHPELGAMSARHVAITVESRGLAMRDDVEIDLRAQALSIPTIGTADDHVTISAKIDRARRALRLVARTSGRTTGKLALTASFDRARHAVAYDVDGAASKLTSAAPLFNIDLSSLEVAIAAKGELTGVVTDVEEDGTTRFAPNPALTAALVGTMDVRAQHFGLIHGDKVVTVPKLAWHGDFRTDHEGRRTLESRLDIRSVHLASGSRVLDVTGISDRLTATVVGDLRNPDVRVADHVVFSAASQDLVPTYPLGDVSLDVSARRDHQGIVHLDSLRIVNAAGGTNVSVAGNLDVSGAERRLALNGTLEQDVTHLSTDTRQLGGRGHASMTMRIESGDLVVFRARGDVHLDGVDLLLPREGIAIEAMYGAIPIDLDVRAANGGVKLVRKRESSPYSPLRFVDQHPLLTRTSFLTARSVTTPFVSIAPLTANLQIVGNVVTLAQLEMGVRGGRVTGEGALDFDGEDATLEVHVRASGVRSSRGDPVDATAALLASAQDRDVNGRAEILRISKQDFRDLLDLVDPARTNTSVNRVRGELWLGSPKRVTVAFNHGFANAHVELGGLASLWRFNDIRGIPTGPLLERLLRSWSKSKGRR